MAGGRTRKSEDCGFVYHTRYFRGRAVPRLLGRIRQPEGVAMVTRGR